MNAKSIFLDAIELPEAQRPEFVRRRCEGDASLTDRVLALVEAHQRADREQRESGNCFSIAPPLREADEDSLPS